MVAPFDLTKGAHVQPAVAPGAKLTSRQEHHLLTASLLVEREFLRNEGAFIRKRAWTGTT
jgi:hypothetical protein